MLNEVDLFLFVLFGTPEALLFEHAKSVLEANFLSGKNYKIYKRRLLFSFIKSKEM